MQNGGFGWQNAGLSAALTASAQTDALPVESLRNPSGAASLGWRSPRSAVSLTLTWPQAVPLRAFSLHRTNLSPAASLAVSASSGGAAVWQGQAQGCVNGQILCIAPDAVQADTVTLEVSDAANTDGWLSIPLAYVGPLWQPVRNYSTQSTAGHALGSDSVTALGGTVFTESRWYQRTLKIVHQSLGDAEAPQIERMLRTAAAGQNILFVPVPDAPAVQINEKSVYGKLTGDDLTNPFGVADRHSTNLTLTESL